MATPSAPSRIFVRGLPPSISDEDFKSHFSKRFNVTDSRLLAHRRIGYVGFKTPEDAAKAIKYFNKSFIRMSKITVEIADNVRDDDLVRRLHRLISYACRTSLLAQTTPQLGSPLLTQPTYRLATTRQPQIH
jgi:RNA recognition motif-containing protein